VPAEANQGSRSLPASLRPQDGRPALARRGCANPLLAAAEPAMTPAGAGH